MHATAKRLYQAAAQLRQLHSPAEVAHALGISQQTLRNWEQKGISKKGIQEMKQWLNVSPEWLMTGSGTMQLDAPQQHINTPLSSTVSQVDILPFALHKLNLVSTHIITAIVQHDNMNDTLAYGETVLIDTSIREYTGSGIYAVESPQGMEMYRLKYFHNGNAMLVNDNPAYPPEMLRPEDIKQLNIIGRVVGKYGVVAL